MANTQRGESEIEVGGVKRLYRLTANACMTFKAMTGVSVLQAATALQEHPDETHLFALMYVGLKAADATLPAYADWADTVGMADLQQFTAAFGDVLGTAFGAPEGNATAAAEPAASS